MKANIGEDNVTRVFGKPNDFLLLPIENKRKHQENECVSLRFIAIIIVTKNSDLT